MISFAMGEKITFARTRFHFSYFFIALQSVYLLPLPLAPFRKKAICVKKKRKGLKEKKRGVFGWLKKVNKKSGSEIASQSDRRSNQVREEEEEKSSPSEWINNWPPLSTRQTQAAFLMFFLSSLSPCTINSPSPLLLPFNSSGGEGMKQLRRMVMHQSERLGRNSWKTLNT